ncbi:uncharacterized protein HD556DRAFT_1234491 [Suillus plorans]|uniref:G domain-containing protein n=1 Tax=Suillus plorans TaxID=116603 RepID=A0A9P7ATI7_9AGAM|nr:uncharacterized protein HD556DRAFT_1234491 [Suillus plorans]KAG1796405.1 hypothetical protein HD556DRAFT_1234491 [Suillus plorans]
MSKNVAIIGQTGAGISSLVNMLCLDANAPTSSDTTRCTKEGKEYQCNLEDGWMCQVHDTVGLGEPGRWQFSFKSFKFVRKADTWQLELEEYLTKKNLESWDLLIYCIPGGRGLLKKSHGQNYKKVKSMAGSVPIVVVVTHLENFKDPLDSWWSDNLSTLGNLGIPENTKHACITALPKHALETFYQKGDLYDNSREGLKTLIRGILWPSTGHRRR